MVQGLLQDGVKPVSRGRSAVLNALSIDVEDYYMVSAFEGHVRREEWGKFESRVERNTLRILDMLDESGARGTFFVVGWIAEFLPALVKEIHRRGHEIGCHGFYHQLVYNLSPEEFRQDLRRTRRAIEAAGAGPVIGFRAPSFSVVEKNLWALDILHKEGFKYDASVFPADHARGGISGAARYPHFIHELAEFPMSTVRLFGKTVPFSGGGYFRLFPYRFIKFGMDQSVKAGKPTIVYLHPWEFDPHQPRLPAAGRFDRFKHYVNLDRTEPKFRRLLREYHFAPVRDVLAASIGLIV
jgi:polysaccharide deacetylase family protein (PEP-CTERM system associated)